MEKLDVLAVAAHPDDAELTCGGTLIKMVDAGYRVGVLDLTAGETGTRGSAELRNQEAEEAARIMGLAVRENLGLPDAGLEDNQANRLEIALAIRRLGPKVLILPNEQSRHPDHALTVRMAHAAAFLAGLGKIEGPGIVARPEKIIYCLAFIEHGPKPSFVVDVTGQFERKQQAIACYRGQFEGKVEGGELFPNTQPLTELVETHCLHYGSLIRTKYGEPFYVRETLAVDD
ncbi:bacillithiol biosynthesis deacetylase BshB1, partial [Gemmatimonadota bacterium]